MKIFKKNTFNLFHIPFWYLIIMMLLDLFLKDYEGHDKFELNNFTYLSIFIVSFLVFISVILHYSEEKDKFIKIAKGFAFSIFFSFFVLLFIVLAKDQTIFYVNKSYSKEKSIEEFRVLNIWYKDSKNRVTIESINNGYFFITKNKFNKESLSNLKEGDTFKLTIEQGLLNKPFLPFGEIEILE